MTAEKQSGVGLKREIGQLGFGTIALNGTIGAGIFALPAIAVERVGLFSPWLYVICGLLIMLVVLTLSRVASYFRDTGGPVTYATAAFGPFVGFQTGWMLTLSRAAAFAANAHLMVTYAGWFWPPLLDGASHMAAVGLVCVALTAINVIGAEIPPLDSLGETALILFYAFVGFESALIPAGEARSPRRDIPRALVKTILAVAVFYFLIQVVTISVAPDIAGSKTPLADVALILMGSAGAAILTLGAVFSITGNLTSSMLSAPRMVYVMAHDGSLPGFLSAVHETYRTPANAIMFYGLFAILLALSGGFIWLAVMSTVVRLLVYIMCILTLPVLHKKLGEYEGQFNLPGGMAIPVLALLLSLWLMTHASLQSWMATGGFMLLGAIFYALKRR